MAAGRLQEVHDGCTRACPLNLCLSGTAGLDRTAFGAAASAGDDASPAGSCGLDAAVVGGRLLSIATRGDVARYNPDDGAAAIVILSATANSSIFSVTSSLLL